MNPLNIGGLKVKLPIIQGGMGVCVSLSGLASAVANEGGIGVISAVGIGMTEPDYRKNFRESNKIALRKEIRKARLKTDGVLGVNIMMAVSDFDDLLKISIEEKIDVAIIGAGLFLHNPADFGDSQTKLIPKVSSARVARLIFKYWSEKYNRVPDAIVVEGPLCGGHIGFKKDEILSPKNYLIAIVQEVIKEIAPYEQKYGIEIPVIAGGGIYTGHDIFEIMNAGAKGVKMGTRFVTTNECDVSDQFKQNYLSSSKNDITIIDSPVGLPGRVISNDFVKGIQQGLQRPVNCPWKCLKTCDYKKVSFCIAEALFNAAQGNFENGFSFAGSNAYLATEITSVKETIDQLKREYLEDQLLSEKTIREKLECGV
ncbi:MAG: nitronate monooxygenase [Bacteroidetes bacterium HGW-Bacteroidetes-6]|jgi:NAD(P)H-dependent flavin oxidoreductase YrpB (nitropropane dioxygenase family)|nr:MAG: nitronate monooxygenase [Bacteroidetes bacterium HGW-Bacteroidetes-6]